MRNVLIGGAAIFLLASSAAACAVPGRAASSTDAPTDSAHAAATGPTIAAQDDSAWQAWAKRALKRTGAAKNLGGQQPAVVLVRPMSAADLQEVGQGGTYAPATLVVVQGDFDVSGVAPDWSGRFPDLYYFESATALWMMADHGETLQRIRNLSGPSRPLKPPPTRLSSPDNTPVPTAVALPPRTGKAAQ